MSRENCIQNIDNLFKEYCNDSLILAKIESYITTELPNILLNVKKSIKSREERKNLLNEGHDAFVNEFLNQNTYFYCATTEIFFFYDKNDYNYKVVKEDDIIHSILKKLSYSANLHQNEYYEQQLLPWKFKIKISIVKKIKEKSIFHTIPESDTIQKIIKLFSDNFMISKNECKYFLTIIGDVILKKQTNNIYFISSKFKSIIRTLENLASRYFGNFSLLNNFKFKFHDHNFQYCRLLQFNHNIIDITDNSNLYESVKKNIINIFAVSTYFSTRYDNSDKYLETIDDDFVKKTLFLKDNSLNNIIKNFILKKIQKSAEHSINFKNMNYIWKCYLEELCLPNIIFSSNLKTILREKMAYQEEVDSFIGYTSTSIPLVSNFIRFWDENIEENIDEYFLEIEEICIIFKNSLSRSRENIAIDNTILLKMIRHFYPDVSIESSKYIYNISCKTLNKKIIIDQFLEKNKDNKDFVNMSLYDKYNHYVKNNKNIIIISKNYFDIYLHNLN